MMFYMPNWLYTVMLSIRKGLLLSLIIRSIIQVLSFFITLTVMWRYEDIHETPSHDVFTIISFALFSGLLFWEGISLVFYSIFIIIIACISNTSWLIF